MPIIHEAYHLSMGKSELLRMMTNARNNFTVGLAGVLMLDLGNISDIRGKSSLVLGENYELPFDQVVALLGEDYVDKLIALTEFLNMLLRAFIKEPYELLKAYCRDTGQLREMQCQPWFQFARIIRNCLSHDFRFDLSKHMKLLPVTWKGKTITGGMHGTRLEHSFFGFNDAIQLFEDLQSFANGLN